MTTALKLDDFLQRYQKKLALSFVSAKVGLDREIRISRDREDSYEAVDYFNVIRTSSVVLVGHQEARHIQNLAPEDRARLFQTLFRGPVSAIITSSSNRLPEDAVRLCEENDIPVFDSALGDSDLLDNTRHFLSRELAEQSDEHGVYMEVYSVGVFLTGDSGVGKSELALALISRGHRLIADDITRFTRVAPDVIDGRSPDLLTDFMEVRGLGIINIRAMFGANSLKQRKSLRLIINMVQLTPENELEFDRVGDSLTTRDILGVQIPEVNLPVASGRNLAVIVETAARNHLLNMDGYNAAEEFIERQRSLIGAEGQRH